MGAPAQNNVNTETLTNLLQQAAPPAAIRKEIPIRMQQGEGTFITFRGLDDLGEHIAVGFGDWKNQASPLVRVHSECLTGDVFGSARCDCGEQLQEAVSTLQKQGGILVYLRQEGRGIGLYNKLDAYELQMQGHDTYEANRLLGFTDDLRSYEVAAQMLQALGIRRLRLLSNNPDKKSQLETFGIVVTELVSTGVFVKRDNRGYLEAKVRKTGHRLNLTFATSEGESWP